MRAGLMILWLMFMGLTSAGQQYSTKSGKIMVSGKYKGISVTAISNHLHMQVSYDRTEMQLRLVIPTMMTDNDSLTALLLTLAGSEAHFTGKMNISYIPTKSHPKQKFLTNGILTINGIAKAFGFTSTLEHFPRGSVSCNLSSEFTIDLGEFGIITGPGENKVTVRFNQLVLKRPGEQ